METNQLQQEFFIYLKSTLPTHLSLADELCDVLNISADSAYRRLRGEKSLTFAELKTICEKFHVSLDQVLNLQNDTVAFRAPDLTADYKTFADYLTNIMMGVKFFHQFKEKKMMYLCKDASLWYFYVFPEMAAFKTFFFLRSLRNEPALSHAKFSFKELPFTDCFEIGQEMLRLFNEIPCEELWNNESWNSTINQVAYYREAGLFKTNDDCELVIDSMLKTIDHLEHQATVGQKFMPGDSELRYRAPDTFLRK
jgi:BetR domain